VQQLTRSPCLLQYSHNLVSSHDDSFWAFEMIETSALEEFSLRAIKQIVSIIPKI
jgi:hypothetical protein